MSTPPPPADRRVMVRVLLAAIAAMTAAIVFIVGMFIVKLVGPAGSPPPPKGTIDFAAAPVVEVGVPAGAKVVGQSIGPDRITLEVETIHGERFIYTAPVTGLDRPVRIVIHSLE